MATRRQLLKSLAVGAGATLTAPSSLRAAHAAVRAERERREAALQPWLERLRQAPADDDFWAQIQRAWPVDRSATNLNNGGVSPASLPVQEAMSRHLAFSHQLPSQHLWEVLEPQKETVRELLAAHWGVDAEELALTRNASEGLQILQLGLPVRPGDALLTTEQDYPRMLTTFEQRARRDGLRVVKIPALGPDEEPAALVERYRAALEEHAPVGLILVSHLTFTTGSAHPVTEVTALGRAAGVPVIVDGAHAFAHLDFDLGELDVDFYATSLHKWLCAPHGTGLLYVRRDRIPEVWSLMASRADQDADIRKFEEIGTHPAANALAVAEALTIHQAIGDARKTARLRALRDHWLEQVRAIPGVRVRTALHAGRSGSIATVDFPGEEPGALRNWLWKEHRVLTASIGMEACRGLRVSPNVYTTFAELDRFAALLRRRFA